MAHLHVLASPDEVAARVALALTQAATAAIGDRGRALLALTGGSVASTCLPRLVDAPIDWRRVHVFSGDERAVPPDDGDSNYGMADRLLLSHVPVPPANIHRMRGEMADIDAAAADYEQVLVEVVGTPPVLDVVLLGVGEDGHVCSLFPGQDPSPAPAGWVAAVPDSPKPPARRITLTMPTLLAARQVVVVVMGEGKASIVQQALRDENSALPLAKVLRGAAHVDLIVDRDAAGPDVED